MSLVRIMVKTTALINHQDNANIFPSISEEVAVISVWMCLDQVGNRHAVHVIRPETLQLIWSFSNNLFNAMHRETDEKQNR